jgi:hypothetical protein
LSYQGGVLFGLANFDDIDSDSLASLGLEIFAKLLYSDPTPAYHDTRLCGLNSYSHVIRRALYLDARNSRLIQLVDQVTPDLDVFVEELGIVPFGKPLGIPFFDETQSKSDGMRLMAQVTPPHR